MVRGDLGVGRDELGEEHGNEELAALYGSWLVCSPSYFLMERWLDEKNVEERMDAKKEVQGNLEKYLERWGI